jgi:hypothetical protein
MHFDGRMRPQKITFGEMREMGIRGVLVYCSDYRCSHSIALSADRWSGVRLSDIEPRFVCKACGQRGADVRPDFDGGQAPFDPIQVDGRKLVTLRDTGEYIAGLPMTVFVYVNSAKQVGDKDHIKLFATTDAAEKWFEENDPEGVAFEYEVLE